MNAVVLLVEYIVGCLRLRGAQTTFCMVRRKYMITMGSPYFVWINTIT
jgi:hypothetical protein